MMAHRGGEPVVTRCDEVEFTVASASATQSGHLRCSAVRRSAVAGSVAAVVRAVIAMVAYLAPSRPNVRSPGSAGGYHSRELRFPS